MSELTSQLLELVNNYRMPEEAKTLVRDSQLLALCGVTAAGKNTIATYLIEHSDFEYVVSHTTRAPRENHGTIEQHGKDYWFVGDAQMLGLINDQSFLEVKAVHGDTFYGTSIQSVEKAIADKKRPITEIDVQGTLELAKEVPGFRPVFILPPNYDIWMERLGTRGFMSEGEKERRMQSAKMELQTAVDNPDFILITNHEVELTAREIIQGLDTSLSNQSKMRDLAKELLDYLI
jgi:guanylate kinase